MSYFSNFPNITLNNNELLDITRGFKIRKDLLAKDELFHIYQLDAGEKPEDVANKFYNDPQDHWLILLVNQITDPFYDWYMSGSEFQEYLLDKYGSGLNDPHHFIDTKTKEILTIPSGAYITPGYTAEDYIEDIAIVNTEAKFSHIDPSNLVTVTNEEYELDLNIKKRSIKILKPEYITQIKNDLEAGFDVI